MQQIRTKWVQDETRQGGKGDSRGIMQMEFA